MEAAAAPAVAFMSRGVWPQWAGWLSVAIGILALASILFFPQFLWLLWVLVVSLLLFLQPARYAAPRIAA